MRESGPWRGSPPYLKKKVEYEVGRGKVNLVDYSVSGAPFATIQVLRASGKHNLYSDHSGKTAVDIHQLQIFNQLVEGAPPVLTYLLKPPATKFGAYNTMVRVRLEDEYLVPYEAQWRVYNQFELFVHPLTVNATKKLYKIVKAFFKREEPRKKKRDPGIPAYFKYFRINLISTLATFTGGFPNLTNFQVDIPAFPKKGKFRSVAKMF